MQDQPLGRRWGPPAPKEECTRCQRNNDDGQDERFSHRDSLPAGFTTRVYDRVRVRRDTTQRDSTRRDSTQRDSTRLTGPTPARLPVGIDFLGLPFREPVLLKIASAYEARTKHRVPPPGFGPLPARASSPR